MKIIRTFLAILLGISWGILSGSPAEAALKTYPQITVTYSGVPAAGETIHATLTGLKPGSSTKFTWLRNGAPITDQATGDLHISSSDLGAHFKLKIQVTLKGYKTHIYQSPEIIEGAITEFAPGSITGNATVGEPLRFVCGVYLPPVAEVGSNCDKQWKIADQEISGETSEFYTPTVFDIAKLPTVLSTISYAGFPSLTKVVNGKTKIQGVFGDDNTQSIVGIPVVGKILTVYTPSYSPNPASIRYQWYSNGKAVSGARSNTYKVKSSDWHRLISVKTTASLTNYKNHEMTSIASSIAYKEAVASTPLVTGFGAWRGCDVENERSSDCWRNAVNSSWISSENLKYSNDDFVYTYFQMPSPVAPSRLLAWRVTTTVSTDNYLALIPANGPGIIFSANDEMKIISKSGTVTSNWHVPQYMPEDSDYVFNWGLYMGYEGYFVTKSAKVEYKFLK